MKTMDIKQGSLIKTVEHAADTIKRHKEKHEKDAEKVNK